MKIKFTKMHGIGNDYIYVDCMKRELEAPGKISVAMSPRHFSVGADGLVMICSSDVADAKMRMFNADGSEGMMCGNAIRCVGKYLYDNGIVKKDKLSVETKSGIKYLDLCVSDGNVVSVSVDMGYAVFEPSKIPVKSEKEIIDSPIEISGGEYKITCVSMGNPHAVTFVSDVSDIDIEKIGPVFENHPMFPERVNTEFVRVIDRRTIDMRVWERGSGETYACGTGACASVAACVKNGLADAGVPVTVRLIGGELTIICADDYRITMSGPAAKVYDGVYEYEDKSK